MNWRQSFTNRRAKLKATARCIARVYPERGGYFWRVYDRHTGEPVHDGRAPSIEGAQRKADAVLDSRDC